MEDIRDECLGMMESLDMTSRELARRISCKMRYPVHADEVEAVLGERPSFDGGYLPKANRIARDAHAVLAKEMRRRR